MIKIYEFFDSYALASTTENPESIASYYSKNFIAAGPEESQAFSNDESFIKWLQEVHTFNMRSGLEKMMVRNIISHPFGKHAIQATVRWGAQFKKLKDKIIEFDIHYLLQIHDTDIKIMLFMSDQDQEQLMKENGLLE